MRKLALAVALVVATAGMTFAQSTGTGSVTVNAAVISGLTITVSGPLNFGNIVQGTTPAALSAQTNGSAPLITVSGNGGSPITMTFGTATLNGPSGSTPITFTPSVYGDSTSTAQGTSSAVTTGGSVNLSGTSGNAGNYYFWLGGSLSAIGTGEQTGSYTGTWTMTVSY